MKVKKKRHMARKGNPISVRLDLNRSSDPSWFSDYYYGKSVYQDVNLRSYFGSIRSQKRLTFGLKRLTLCFRIGRCIILHFPKRTFIQLLFPRLPRRRKRRGESRPREDKVKWWEFGKVERVSSLKGTEAERKEVGGRASGKRVESIRLDDRGKQNAIRIWPKKMQRYGYHDRSPSITTKSLRVSEALKHPTYAEVLNDIASRTKYYSSITKYYSSITKYYSSIKTLLFKFFPQLKFFKKEESLSGGPTSHLLKRTPPAVRPSLNYLVMQYFLNKKQKMHFDPVHVLNHFVASGVAEPGGAREESLDKRIRSRIAFFVESSTSEKKCLAQAKKRLIHFIRLANDLRFAGTRKTSISLFPFFGATFLFPRDGREEDKNVFKFQEYASQGYALRLRALLIRRFRRKCWNLMGKNKVMELIEKFIDPGRREVLIRRIEMMISIIILRKRRIPSRDNAYLCKVLKTRSFLSKRTNTKTLIESVKIKSVYQSASLIAQDISFQPRNNQISFRSILSKIGKGIPLRMRKGVEGIRISCSGRLGGAEIARTECVKYGKTSCNVFNQKIDYAAAKVSTRYGILGVKVWISYSQ